MNPERWIGCIKGCISTFGLSGLSCNPACILQRVQACVGQVDSSGAPLRGCKGFEVKFEILVSGLGFLLSFGGSYRFCFWGDLSVIRVDMLILKFVGSLGPNRASPLLEPSYIPWPGYR